MQRVILVVLFIFITFVSVAWASAEDTSNVGLNWAAPTVQAIKRVSSVMGAQHEPYFMNNFDCQLTSYRLVSDHAMLNGCFTPTAFGLLDSDTTTIIYNGTDEGLPLLPYSPHQLLMPWANAGNLIALDSVPTGGSYISLYKNPLAKFQDERNNLGKLIAKRLTGPPELMLRDANGQRLIVNVQTIAISDGGSWLVAETLTGSFVRINLATLDVVAFAPSYGSQGGSGQLRSEVAVSENGQYVAIHNHSASEFKVYNLSTCGGSGSCLSHDYKPYISSQINGLQFIRHVRFINDSLLGFEATSSTEANSGVYELAPTASIQYLTEYIGLGDSYTSGDGAFDYISGTDDTNSKCHLSVHSYPLLLTKDLFSNAGGHSVACSGTTINDVGNTSQSYKGQIRGVLSLSTLQKDQPTLLESVESNFIPGYIAQHRFIKRWQPHIATVSVGGNDIGFGKILQQCVVPRVSLHLSDNTCFNTYEDRLEIQNLIDQTVPRWTTLYKQLRSQSPATQLYVIGYPDILDDTGKCAVNVHLGKSELEFAAELLVYINKGIQQAATSAGVPYVDISKALVGHRLCETASHNVAVNGLTAGGDMGVFGRESYHPNALGHQLIEHAILKKTNNLKLLDSSTAPSGTKLLEAPKTGRAIMNRQPAAITNPVIRLGAKFPISVSGSLLKPLTAYQLRLNGPSGTLFGSGITDDSGNIITEATLPATTSPGGHTIDIVGSGQTGGNPVNVTQPVYVPATEADSDGDGISDATDSCPGAINLGQDVDQDNIDDVCDPLIGTPPVTNPSATTNVPPATPTTTSPSVTSPVSIQPRGSVVTSFAAQTSTPLATKSRKQINVGSTSLHSKTVDPTKSSATQLLPMKPDSVKSAEPWINPKVLWWLWWLIIPFVLWLLLAFFVYVSGRLQRSCNLTTRGKITVQ